jgi:hypothetical protein
MESGRVNMRRVTAAFVLVALVLAGCSGGPSTEERSEFDRFALERMGDYPPTFTPDTPTSIKEYVMGGSGITQADYIVAGAFTGATTVGPNPSASDPSAYTLIGQFKLHQSLRGNVPSTFDVDLGTVRGTLLIALAARGAGDVVLFLDFDATTEEWELVDGGWALAQSDGGALSMPLVPASKEAQYLSGVTDVSDIESMIIAANIDPNGSVNGGLDDLGNEGLTGTEQDLIDQANDITD